jgi:hypothetical protein
MKTKLTLILFSFFVFTCNGLFADTIRLMQYNLLYYTNNANYTDCDEYTNNLDQKDLYLKNIIKYAQPDVFCVNELGKEEEYTERILNNVLNQGGVNYYATIPTVNSWSTISNRIFYDTRKFRFKTGFYVWTPIIYINGYQLYYNSAELQQGDTTYLTFIVVHLKAGSYEGNETSRYEATLDLMNRLETMGQDNYILSGDFNCYGHLDSGVANVLYWDNANYRFHDPLNQLGEWGSNEDYAALHTQSTHAGSEDACFSGGGMDDRFDLILVSPYVYYGLKGVKSINSSYRALGQDGNRYNKSLLNPTNNSVPNNVLVSLYGNSDHLPVMMDFEIEGKLLSVSDNAQSLALKARVVNPVRDDMEIILESPVPQNLEFRLFSIEGKFLKTFQHNASPGINQFVESFSYPAGAYILQVIDSKKQTTSIKLFK